MSGGNLNKKRKRIKPLCDSSNSSSDEESVRKKSMTSEGSSRSSTSRLKEKGRSTHESSSSSEDEDDKKKEKKEKKRFISTGNESTPKTDNLVGNLYSRSKSVDFPSKFGVLNKKKSPELVNRQQRYKETC